MQLPSASVSGYHEDNSRLVVDYPPQRLHTTIASAMYKLESINISEELKKFNILLTRFQGITSSLYLIKTASLSPVLPSNQTHCLPLQKRPSYSLSDSFPF